MCLRFNLGQRLRLTFPSRLRVTRAAEAGVMGREKEGRPSLSLAFLLPITPLAPLRKYKERQLGTSQGLLRKRNLSPVSKFCQAAPVSLFWAYNGLNDYRSNSNFRSTWLANRQWPFTRPIIARTQTLVHWWGAPTEKGFRHCFAEGLNRKISSVWVAGYLTYALESVRFYLTV